MSAVVGKISGHSDGNCSNFKSELRGDRQIHYRRGGFKRRFEQSPRENVKKNKLDVGNRLKESDLGITEYIGDSVGFSAIIKERYTDFHVNEVDLNGQVAKLTHQDIPREPEDDEDIEDLKKSIPSAIWDQVQTLKDDSSSSDVEIDVTSLNKSARKAIHTVVKKLLNVISQTVNKDDKKFITIVMNSKNNKTVKKMHRDNRIDWKRRGGDYCHFLLLKVNMDTMDVLNQLAARLRTRPDNFSYAGTKDRRAWTTQWVSLRKVHPSDILRTGKTIRGVYVGNFKYAKYSLKLGMLHGNQFRIALRDVRGSDEEIERAMTSLRDNGFINYYGLQRFGTVAAIPTHEIGKCLLQGKWHEAIELILKPREGERDEELAEARQIYAETKNACAAYAKIKRVDKIEARLLKGLWISGNKDPIGALDSIPRNIRLMYMHAYQSFVWNRIVSRRIKRFGADVIVGDLVYEKQCCKETTDYSLDGTNDLKDESDVASTEEKNADKGTEEKLELAKTSDGLTEEHEDAHDLPAVKVLTEKDLPNYTLADVIMPQPGWKVTYPLYAKPWFDEFLVKDGLTTDLKQKNKKYSLGGSYRTILGMPTNFSWKIMRYNEKHDDLISSDIDEMRKRTPPQDKPDGQHKALIIEMCLKSSNYATMALREILKKDTSAETQAALSASHCMETTQLHAEKITDESDSADLTESDKAGENHDIKFHEDFTDAKKDETIGLNEAEDSV
ncbi:PREDICTED: pseudouridylate synthase 7 homolog [Dinoponera quadriceps]|uniref:Pseudouridylate synthase 7 homolog n=1 Tax=Dinoponera quadriceps TaxID=609295 RepID=A0A6P3Y333_DINQU|nr:PREDICTED: pseudouridylate synthase 7 homolog [Dinoponera quadriceps]